MPRLNSTICQGAPARTLRRGITPPPPGQGEQDTAAPAPVTAETGTPSGAVTK